MPEHDLTTLYCCFWFVLIWWFFDTVLVGGHMTYAAWNSKPLISRYPYDFGTSVRRTEPIQLRDIGLALVDDGMEYRYVLPLLIYLENTHLFGIVKSMIKVTLTVIVLLERYIRNIKNPCGRRMGGQHPSPPSLSHQPTGFTKHTFSLGWWLMIDCVGSQPYNERTNERHSICWFSSLEWFDSIHIYIYIYIRYRNETNDAPS